MSLDPWRVREEFPEIVELSRKGYVYLDANATTPKPRRVIEAVRSFYERSYATIRRGVYGLTMDATRLFEEALESIASLINAEAEEVVPSFNSTDAMNMLALSIAPSLERGDVVILSRAEHHSTIMPWRYVCRLRGCSISWADLGGYGEASLASLRKRIEEAGERLRAVVAVHVSNVNGVINPLKEICSEARRAGALCIGDLAQSVSHMPVDVKDLGIEAGVFSGHKMFGPSGTGVLYLRKDLGEELEPGKAGSGMITRLDPETLEVEYEAMPWKFVPGTPNIEGFIGLGEAAEFLKEIGMWNVLSHLRRLQGLGERLVRDLLGERVEIYSPPPERGTGVLSLNLMGIEPHALAFQLDLRGFAVRSGHHCAYPMHRAMGVEKSVRASPHIYNTPEDLEGFARALEEIAREGAEEVVSTKCALGSC